MNQEIAPMAPSNGSASKPRWRLPRPNFVALAACAPAVLAAMGVVAVAVACGSAERESMLAAYLKEAERSRQAGYPQEAALCFERACTLQPSSPALRFALVRALDAAGQSDRADALLTQLAPATRSGYAPAQVWKAARLTARGPVGPAVVRDIDAHLTRALEADPQNVDAHRLLGLLYAQTNRLARARSHLAAAASAYPELLLPLAAAYRAAGDKYAARQSAEDAAKHFRKRVADEPGDQESRLIWAEALVRLGDHAAAVRAIQEGLDRDGTSAVLARGLGDVIAAWADSVEEQRPDSLTERMNLLDVGLRRCPAHHGLLERLSAFLRADKAGAELARTRLQALLTNGQAAPTVHFLLGNDDAQHGRVEEARVHFEQAYRLTPTAHALANNLAWTLVEGPNPDPERALTLINTAIDAYPNEPRFRSTRGHILVRMKRWKEALADLETALVRENTSAEVHGDLAVAYENLDLPDLAAAHRQAATSPDPTGNRSASAR